IKKLDGFLNLNDRDILNDAGKVTHELAKQNAGNEYEKFRKSEQKRIDSAESDFDKLIRKLPKKKK
ncbi:MAG TPA: hydroxyacid dehydrogenase, partial [Ignavibacteria bacterium]|nr:hydroxyacid dehydrogenase [Ignavibacteria bacterium]